MPHPASSNAVQPPPLFGNQSPVQGKLRRTAHSRPLCAAVSFNLSGRVARALPSGAVRERAIQGILQQKLPDWYHNLEQFPGPLGRVEQSTSEVLAEQLRKLADRCGRQALPTFSLEAAVKHPHSVALVCQFLTCLLASGGKVQSHGFWQQFAPVLAERAAALRPEGEPSQLQRFSAKVASGNVSDALELACQDGLWPHALVLGQLISPAAYSSVLVSMSTSMSRADGRDGTHSTLSSAELADPALGALLLLYEVLGKKVAPEITPGISKAVVAGWPAYLAMFATILNSDEHRGLAIGFLENLGNTLALHGDVFGAHLCYLLTAERSLEAVDAPTSLVCLLGVEHRSHKNFSSLLEPLALQLSEVFEYALRSGDADALCPTLQPFKLVHAILLADVGLTEKARRYMTLLQAFVKAVPQNRLSDAFRSSMREVNDVLNPSVSFASQDTSGPRAGVGKGLKDLFRGIAETTGLKVKPTPPPALGGPEEPETRQHQQPYQQPYQHQQPQQIQQQQQHQHQPFQQQTSAPFANAASAVGLNQQSEAQQAPLSSLSVSPPAPQLQMTPSLPPGDSAPPLFMQEPQLTLSQSTMNVPNGVVPPGNAQGAPFGEQHGPPVSMPSNDPFEQDPLLNAGKAVWSGMKGLFSAVKSGGGGPDSRAPQGVEKDNQPAESGFYFDKEKNMWRQRGVDDVADTAEYDYMTGKKLSPTVNESLPAPPPPPMGAPPAGGCSMGMSAASSFGAQRSSASLYVNPLASASPGGAMHAPPNMAAGPPRGAPLANGPGPLASPFGTQQQVATAGTPSTPLASPFGNQQQTPAVRKSPFG